MSSLAASKADNFYFPPEWRPEMGSISKFQGSKGANQYEQYGIIRFELPFDGWCLGCKRHMSKGLRFNAKKDRDGKYFTTTIYMFTMKCYSCDMTFKVRTNPKDRTYDFVEGLRKHEQEYSAEDQEGIIHLLTDEERFQLSNDPIAKLQHTNEDTKRAKTQFERLTDLQDLQEKVYKDDFSINSLLRKKNRAVKKQEQEQLEEGRKRGVTNIRLLDLDEKDEAEAKKVFQEKKLIDQYGSEREDIERKKRKFEDNDLKLSRSKSSKDKEMSKLSHLSSSQKSLLLNAVRSQQSGLDSSSNNFQSMFKKIKK
jgi:hypothetical protein